MHYTFTIFKSADKLKEQWTFLAKRAYQSYNEIFKKNVLIFCCAIFLEALLLFLTPTDSYVTLKAISTILLTLYVLFLLIFSLVVAYKNFQYRKFVDRNLEILIADQQNYTVELNEHHVKIITGLILNEYSWSDFSAFGINNNTIYIFNPTNPILSIFWSLDQIGDEVFSNLIDILKKKEISQRF